MELHENFNIILKSHHENKLAHSFLIETNDIVRCSGELVDLLKRILCEDFDKNHRESECNLCSMITNNSLPSLKIIEPDGSTIKKNQILELKDKFQAIPIMTDVNVYVIKNAEKLNTSSANAMLKFLEEPDGQVIGFFITNNKRGMISTIVSRCHFYQVKYLDYSNFEKYGICELDYKNFIESIAEYLQLLEGKDKFISQNYKKELLSVFDDRKKIELMMLIILDVYSGIFQKKNNCNYDSSLVDRFEFLSQLSLSQLKKKIILIKNIIIKLKYNLNMELLLDMFAIEMGRINE